MLLLMSSSLNNAILMEMYKFAFVVQDLIKKGFSFYDIEYGDDKFGISSKIYLMKSGNRYVCRSVEDLENLSTQEEKFSLS